MKKNVFIGGAWPYANNSMHVGHIAALLPGDVLARYHRQLGDSVMYVSGSDSHGTPITNRAKKEGIEPAEIANLYHKEFVQVFNDLDFSYDVYSATTDEFHKEKVKEQLLEIYKNGYIYEKEEEQDFCPNCNIFLSDREIIGECIYCNGQAKGDQCDSCFRSLESNELKNKRCSFCNTKTISKKNKHLYFKQSEFQSIIQKLLDSNKDFWRKNAINETTKYLNQGLHDRAITRDLSWGIDVPFDGYENKKVYVWIEAVMGYLTMLKKGAKENYRDFITNKENTINYYVHGKDNIPFHTIIWPSLLYAIDKEYQLPKGIISSEHLNFNDEKMSKSTGNLVTAKDLIKEFNKDTLRYYFIINNPEKRDSNFSYDELVTFHNKFLVGGLGNFINRNLSFVLKKFDGFIPKSKIDNEIKTQTINLYKETSELIENGNLKKSLSIIFDYVSLANKYYDEQEPWNKARENIEEFYNVTYTCIYMIANLGNLLLPFIPETANKILNIVNVKSNNWKEIVLTEDFKINSIELLFNRIEKNL